MPRLLDKIACKHGIHIQILITARVRYRNLSTSKLQTQLNKQKQNVCARLPKTPNLITRSGDYTILQILEFLSLV